MTVFYCGPFESVSLPSGLAFPNGEPVEVSEELGLSLTARDDFSTSEKGSE